MIDMFGEKYNINIFDGSLVNDSNDIFWQELPADISAISHKNMLVISLPFVAGSPEESQLNKMMAACKLQSGDFNIIQIQADSKIAWHRLRDQLKPMYILLLGIVPAQLGISALFATHTINHYDGAIWIPTVSLEQLSPGNELKQHLWTKVFKPLFLK